VKLPYLLQVPVNKEYIVKILIEYRANVHKEGTGGEIPLFYCKI